MKVIFRLLYLLYLPIYISLIFPVSPIFLGMFILSIPIAGLVWLTTGEEDSINYCCAWLVPFIELEIYLGGKCGK